MKLNAAEKNILVFVEEVKELMKKRKVVLDVDTFRTEIRGKKCSINIDSLDPRSAPKLTPAQFGEEMVKFVNSMNRKLGS